MQRVACSSQKNGAQRHKIMLPPPEELIAGCSIHYFRIHPYYWEDRLLRMKAMGLNTVEVSTVASRAAGTVSLCFSPLMLWQWLALLQPGNADQKMLVHGQADLKLLTVCAQAISFRDLERPEDKC